MTTDTNQHLPPLDRDDQRRLVEWLDVPCHDQTELLQGPEWKAAIGDVCRLPGCKGLSTARPVEPPERLWILIEWWPASSRKQPQQSDACSTFRSRVEHLKGDNNDNGASANVHWIFCLGAAYKRVIQDEHKTPPLDRIHEIFTVYFPADIFDEATSRLKNMPEFPKVEGMSQAMDDLLESTRGWVEGEVRYKGRAARRLVYFVLWATPDSEQVYKETQSWFPKVSRDGEKLSLAMECFLDDLKECGMLGYESSHGRFGDMHLSWMT